MGVTVKSGSYIFPPRPQMVLPFSECGVFEGMGWVCQLKFNDSRSLFKFEGGELSHWNRHGERFRDIVIPDHVRAQLFGIAGKFGSGTLLLDGGYLDRKHRITRDTIVLWDILVVDGMHLVGSTYSERLKILRSVAGSERFVIDQVGDVGQRVSDNIFLSECHAATNRESLWSWMYEINKKIGGGDLFLEGLVWKAMNIPLEYGFTADNNTDWLAKSRFKTKRVRC